ncbi:hypothetical protein [Liquorilactobacillus aquaticus]|nr:hypothetical protein [Liquorilactobacillus aquaticus]
MESSDIGSILNRKYGIAYHNEILATIIGVLLNRFNGKLSD